MKPPCVGTTFMVITSRRKSSMITRKGVVPAAGTCARLAKHPQGELERHARIIKIANLNPV